MSFQKIRVVYKCFNINPIHIKVMKITPMPLISLLFLFLFFSCENGIEKKIEKEFKTYVNENFGEPSDLKEIVSIELKDTVSYADISNIVKKARNISDIIEGQIDTIHSWSADGTLRQILTNNSEDYSLKKALKDYADMMENTYLFDFKYKIRQLREFDINDKRIIYFHYIIKTRIKEEQEAKIYHAYIDSNGKIKIKNKAMLTGEAPEDYLTKFKFLEDFYITSTDIMDKTNTLIERVTFLKW